MLPHFDLTQIRLGGPVFDLDKLRWLNGRYNPGGLHARAASAGALPVGPDDGYIERVLGVVGDRMETLGDWARRSGMFCSDGVNPSPEDLKAGGLDTDGVLELLQVSLWYLEDLDEWNENSIRGVFERLSGEFGTRPKELNAPFYAALTGSRVGPPLYSGMEVLGPDLSRRRIHAAMEVSGGNIRQETQGSREKPRPGLTIRSTRPIFPLRAPIV